MAFQSKPAPGSLGEGVKGNTGTSEEAYPFTTGQADKEDIQFVGGGWGGWNGGSTVVSIGIAMQKGDKE